MIQANTRAGFQPATGIAEARPVAVSVLGIFMLVSLCAAAIVIGWGLVLASLLYVVAEYSKAAWVLTALGLALGHAVLATCCWHFALGLGREFSLRMLQDMLQPPIGCRTGAAEQTRAAPAYSHQAR